jgi:threonine dehydrogenase-like Zn-dependent dehydrogenase
MRAIHFDGMKLRGIVVPRPRARRGEALVKVRLAGICSTDLEIVRGYMAFRGIPGHEFVGEVVEASTRSLIGRRVVGEINVPCGRCELCRAGLGKHCASRSVLGIARRNGAFAELLALPEKNLHVVPSRLSDEEAVFTELVAAACEIPERISIGARDTVIVLGDGRLGAMAAQVVSLRSKHVAVLGMNRRKLSVLRRLGIKTHGPRDRTRLLRSADFVIECTGSPRGLPLAARLVRPQGAIVLKSTFQGALDWNPAPLVVDEIIVAGSRCGPFATALGLLARKKVKVLPFLTAIYPFERWGEAFRRAQRRDSFKVLLRMP